jgi:hypothetical protein
MGLTQQILEQEQSENNQRSLEEEIGFGKQGADYQTNTNTNNSEESDDSRRTITESELREKAQSDIGKDKLKELITKYMPSDSYNKMEKGEMNIKEYVEEINHISTRVINSKDIENMSESDRLKFENRVAKKIKLYDSIKKYTGIDCYSIENSRMLKKAKKIESVISTNLADLNKELTGRAPSYDFADLHQKILDSIPEHVREDKNYSSIIDYLSKGAKSKNRQTGVKGVLRELGEKQRTLRDLDDMLGASIAEYQQTMSTIKEDITKLNQELGKEPGNKTLVQERMNKNTMFNTYIAEKEKLEETQDRVLDDMLDAHSDYELLKADIDFKEAAIHSTRNNLRYLKSGIKLLESTIKTKGETVRVGNHMMYVQEAREIADKVNLVAPIYGGILVNIIKKMTNSVKSGLGYNGMNKEEFKQLNDSAKQARREQVEIIKSEMD